MTKNEIFDMLRPPKPTPSEELCSCSGNIPIKLMSALVYNPLHCIKCNREVPPERLPIKEEHIKSIAYWRNIYDAIDRLWLASGEYENWAKEQLSDINSPVNIEGRKIQKDINEVYRCYYWYFQDESEDNYVYIKVCPICGNLLEEYKPGHISQLICESCDLICAGE